MPGRGSARANRGEVIESSMRRRAHQLPTQYLNSTPGRQPPHIAPENIYHGTLWHTSNGTRDHLGSIGGDQGTYDKGHGAVSPFDVFSLPWLDPNSAGWFQKKAVRGVDEHGEDIGHRHNDENCYNSEVVVTIHASP